MGSDAEQRQCELHAVTLGEPARLAGPVALHEYDPRWPELYAREAERIRGALDARVLLLEHCGSTSVPGLAAKPRIDVVLAVADSADEPAWHAAGRRERARAVRADQARAGRADMALHPGLR